MKQQNHTFIDKCVAIKTKVVESTKEILERVTNIGIDKTISIEEAKHLKIYNRLAISSTCILSFFPFLFIYLEMYEGLYLCLFGGLAIILPFVINYFQYFVLARMVALLLSMALFLMGLLFFGYDAGFIYGVMALLVLPILYFRTTKNRISAYCFVAIEGILFFCLFKNNIPYFYEPPEKVFLNIVLLSSCTLLVISYFISSDSINQIYAKKNINLVEQLTQKNEELMHFSYSTSHDLKQPLRTIINFVSLFKKRKAGRLDEEEKIYLKFIDESSERLNHLIDALLKHSVLGQTGDKEIVDCNSLIRDVMNDLDKNIQETNATILLGKLPVVDGNKHELNALFQNLISNAIKFQNEHKPPKIQIEARAKDDYWQFQVRDNGIGIHQQAQGKIFQIFQKGHANKNIQGTGIGLANCKKIVELHGGKIWVESKEGFGSTFFFTLKQPE